MGCVTRAPVCALIVVEVRSTHALEGCVVLLTRVPCVGLADNVACSGWFPGALFAATTVIVPVEPFVRTPWIQAPIPVAPIKGSNMTSSTVALGSPLIHVSTVFWRTKGDVVPHREAACAYDKHGPSAVPGTPTVHVLWPHVALLSLAQPDVFAGS